MKKWIVTSNETENAGILVNAVCRYLNSSSYPNMETMAAILGIEGLEIEEPEDKPCTEE